MAIVDEPDELRDLLVGLPPDVDLDRLPSDEPDVVIAFFSEHSELESRLDELADAVFPDRTIWIAWPKKTSGVTTDLTGDVVRATVLTTKLVDVKVCAISETWSGLKVVWRKEHR